MLHYAVVFLVIALIAIRIGKVFNWCGLSVSVNNVLKQYFFLFGKVDSIRV